MITRDVIPHLPTLDGEPFRQKYVYNSLVNLVLARNQVVLRRLYEGSGTEAITTKLAGSSFAVDSVSNQPN